MMQRILIADDQEASRKGLAALVATWGYEVEDAGDGDEALAKAIEHNPAVVITDLVMPKRDGLGLLKALQAELPVHHGHHRHRPRHHRDRGGGDQGRRLRLPDQAGRRGAPSPPRREGHREGRGAARGQRAAPAGQGGVGPRPPGRDEQGDAGGVPPDRPRRADVRARPHRGRERHRQGAGGPDAPRALAAQPGPLRRRELRGHPRDPAGERDLRPREGRLHRRARPADRAASSSRIRARSSSTRSRR